MPTFLLTNYISETIARYRPRRASSSAFFAPFLLAEQRAMVSKRADKHSMVWIFGAKNAKSEGTWRALAVL
jgi:hypothetical protein